MSSKKKRGRPPLPKSSVKEGRLYCRLLKSEVAEIELAAQRAKKTQSAFVREVLLAAARAIPPAPTPDPIAQSAESHQTT